MDLVALVTLLQHVSSQPLSRIFKCFDHEKKQVKREREREEVGPFQPPALDRVTVGPRVSSHSVLCRETAQKEL